MERYIPITGIDCTPASLLIDSQAPLDVLHATADYRIRVVTQVLESIAFRSEITSDTVVLSDFAQLLVIPLRDGVSEMRVFIGPGYRIYFVRTGISEYLMLSGSDKTDQKRGIKRAKVILDALRGK